MLDRLSEFYTETVHVTAAELPNNWKRFGFAASMIYLLPTP